MLTMQVLRSWNESHNSMQIYIPQMILSVVETLSNLLSILVTNEPQTQIVLPLQTICHLHCNTYIVPNHTHQ